MKKDIKRRYRVAEQLNSKTSSLLIIASSISVLLLLVYFGVSLTSKGTFSAGSPCITDDGLVGVIDSEMNCIVVGSTCVTSTGVAGVIDIDGLCHANLDGQRLAISTGCYRCESDGATVYQRFLIGADLPDYCGEYPSDDYEYNGTSCVLKGNSNTCNYQVRNAGTDEVSIVTTESCCSELGTSASWNSSSQTCKYPVTNNTGYYSYDNLGFANWCATSNMFHEWNNKCIMCKAGYSPDDTQGCIENGSVSSPRTVTITFRNDDNSLVDTRSCTIPEGSNTCPTDLYFPGPTTSANNAGTFNGWGDAIGCTTGGYAANGSLHITRDSRNQTYYACYHYQEPVTSSSSISCSYSPWSVVTRDQNHLNCIYTNITYDTNQGHGTTGDIQACCTQKGYTWVGENYTSSGYGYEYCIICGTGGQTINADRCIKSSATIKRVTSCDLTADQISDSDISCNGSDTSTAQGMCTLSDGTRVPRCDVADVSNSHCSSSSTETITCYYCDSNNSRKSFTLESSANGNCNNSTSHPGASSNSNLSCSEPDVDTVTRTCYYCDGMTSKSKQVTMSADEGCHDYNSSYYASQVSCSKTCYYCNGTDKESVSIPRDENCSDREGYASTADALTCASNKKTCWKCDGKTKVAVQIELSDECSNHTGYKTNKNDLTCIEETKCCVCNGNTKVTKGNSTNGKCPSGQTICTQLVCKNEQTGSTAIVIAWIIGILAIGYSFYYFRQTSKQK